MFRLVSRAISIKNPVRSFCTFSTPNAAKEIEPQFSKFDIRTYYKAEISKLNDEVKKMEAKYMFEKQIHSESLISAKIKFEDAAKRHDTEKSLIGITTGMAGFTFGYFIGTR